MARLRSLLFLLVEHLSGFKGFMHLVWVGPVDRVEKVHILLGVFTVIAVANLQNSFLCVVVLRHSKGVH